MTDLQANLVVALVGALVPILALLGGGQAVLDRYDKLKASHAQQLEFARFLRERQYDAAEEAYALFGSFMGLYRRINWGVEHGRPRPEPPWLSDTEKFEELANRAVELEERLESLIMRIGAESSGSDSSDQLEMILGNVRQSAHVWRESLVEGSYLPFYGSESRAYLRFKFAFVDLCSHLAAASTRQTSPIATDAVSSRRLLRAATGNTYESSEAMRAYLERSVDE